MYCTSILSLQTHVEDDISSGCTNVCRCRQLGMYQVMNYVIQIGGRECEKHTDILNPFAQDGILIS